MELYFLFLSVLLCIIGSSEITAVTGRSNDEIVARKMQFVDLTVDVLHLIYDELNLEDIMNMKETNKQLASFTDEFFCHKWLHCRIAFSLNGDKYKVFDTYIEINDNQFIWTFLKHFGELIHRLHFDYQKSREILPHMTKPLENVETFICFIDVNYETEFNVIPLNQLVPNVRKMILNLEYENDYSFLDCKLPHLKDLDITVRDEFWNQTDAIDRLIKKNLQIQKISMTNLPNDYVKFISELLPDLEDLFLSKFDIGNDSIRFENVQRFSLFRSNPNSIINLSFPRLEYLWFRYYSTECFNLLTTFFRDHGHLIELYIGDFRAFNSLTELTADLPNLTVLGLKSDFKRNTIVDIDEIARFVEQHQKLTKIELSFYKNLEINLLRNRFENEWNIDYDDSYRTTLEKKRQKVLQ